MALVEPESKASSTEQVYEWAVIDGEMTKITQQNSNGRKCLGCGCHCPCRCADCRPICCSINVGKIER